MKRLLALALVAVLTACGGGGDDPKSPEGLYTNDANPTGAFVLVEADGQFWGLGTNGTVAAVQVGTSTHTDSTITGSGTQTGYGIASYNFTLAGTYVPKSSMLLTLDAGVYGKGAASFTYGSGYDTALMVPAKVYTGTTATGDALSINMSSNGIFSGFGGTCSFDGILTQTGKNYQKVSLTYHGGTCVLGTSTVRGIIFGSPSQFAVMLKNSSNQVALAIIK